MMMNRIRQRVEPREIPFRWREFCWTWRDIGYWMAEGAER